MSIGKDDRVDRHLLGAAYDRIPKSVFKCYQCDRSVSWLAPDSRCVNCTRCTLEEVQGVEQA